MEPITVTARPRTVQALQYGRASLSELRALAPGATFELAENEGSVVVIASPGSTPRVIRPGYWVTWDGARVSVHTAEAFALHWDTGSESGGVPG